MTSVQATITAAVLALLLGIGVGWWVGHKVDMADQAAALIDQHKADQKAADDRVAAEQKAAHDVTAQLVVEQTKSALLDQQNEALRATNASLQDTIAHVQFHPVSKPAVANNCPGSSISSIEFLQLYNAAATGAPTAEHPAGHAGGVP